MKKSKKCKCPFCEAELEFSCLEPPFCQVCKIKFTVCKKCGQIFNEKLKKCPKCGNSFFGRKEGNVAGFIKGPFAK